jgi:4a-hydroxytetrahydrobiopterin dehydratase
MFVSGKNRNIQPQKQTFAALLAERADHHPEWFNVYNKVVVDLTTHEAGGISAGDYDLARRMEEIASGM